MLGKKAIIYGEVMLRHGFFLSIPRNIDRSQKIYWEGRYDTRRSDKKS